ncbi:hypothetical protein K501DRAFT_192208 [Backusella circina FSU 941]|nr:hypothetical protein K501DRAFT_192208 [Backusella circina FSU 941]
MEKHDQIVRELNDGFKEIDRQFRTNEMRVFGKNTSRIFKELDIIRRKQIDLAGQHVSLESINDIP